MNRYAGVLIPDRAEGVDSVAGTVAVGVQVGVKI